MWFKRLYEYRRFYEIKRRLFYWIIKFRKRYTLPWLSFWCLCSHWFKKIYGNIYWVDKGNSKNKIGKNISIDGKAIKNTTDKINNGNIPYIVSAFIGEIGLLIGQVKVDDKSNEITAIPDLLDLLEIEGATITIDAIGTQEEIVNKKGHYVLPVKDNQKELKKTYKISVW